MNQILLENMEFYSYHGHYPEEQKIGNRFVVSVSIDTDLKKSSETDNLADAIDYRKVYEIVKQEMQVPSKLLEHVAGRMVESIYKAFNGIEKVTVKVTKLNPPLGGKTEGVSIVMTQ
ncbi:MAG: dihydroneopterin aldolase [Bacteroidales bacterium]|nr:dihydroneopterin aldolase [Bacteroidales bacterium]